MQTYYVHIPGSEAPTAEVSASSTKHARTTYLDYLSRNGLISWGDRQATRGAVKVSRMVPGEFKTQLQLDYDMEKVPTQEVQPPEQARVPAYEEGLDEGQPAVTLSDLQRQSLPYEGQAQPTQQYDPFANSPIARLSKKTKGM